MNFLEIDNRIKNLTKKLGPLNQRLEYIEGEIEDLEFEKDVDTNIAQLQRPHLEWLS